MSKNTSIGEEKLRLLNLWAEVRSLSLSCCHKPKACDINTKKQPTKLGWAAFVLLTNNEYCLQLWRSQRQSLAGSSHIDDLLNVQCVNLTVALDVTPHLYHVASDFLAAVAPKAWDFTGNLLGDKAVTVLFDCTKLKRAVPAFQATTRFDEGVRRCVAYLLAHPELQVEDPAFDAWCDSVIEAQERAKTVI